MCGELRAAKTAGNKSRSTCYSLDWNLLCGNRDVPGLGAGLGSLAGLRFGRKCVRLRNVRGVGQE